MTPAGIEPATFRFVAQNLNRCATAVPNLDNIGTFNYTKFASQNKTTKKFEDEN